MSLSIYINNDFEHQHEREIFDKLCDSIENEYANSKEDIIILGNFKCANDIDAAIIKNDAFIIVEFKNYSGDLVFKENGPWRVQDVEILTSGYQNPFEQTKKYRNGIIDFLREKFKSDDIDWRRFTKAIVLFGGDIICKETPFQFEQKNPWFRISDIKNATLIVSRFTTPGPKLANDKIKSIPDLMGLKKQINRRSINKINTNNQIENYKLFDSVFKLYCNLKIINIASNKLEEYVKSHRKLIKSYDEITTFEILNEYINITKLNNYDSCKIKLIENLEANLEKQIKNIQNLNSNINYYKNDETEKSNLLNLNKVKELCESIKRHENYNSLNRLEIDSYILDTASIFTYERRILWDDIWLEVRNEIISKTNILPLLHAIFEIARTWFAEDMMKHWLPGHYGRTEHDFSKGICKDWINNINKKFDTEILFEYNNDIVQSVVIPDRIVKTFKFILDEMGKKITQNEIDKLLDSLKLNWIKSNTIRISDIFLIEIRTKFIFNQLTDYESILKSRIKGSHRPNESIYEPSYISILELIGQWGYGKYPMSEDSIRNSIEYLDNTKLKEEVKTIIAIWKQYKPSYLSKNKNHKREYTWTNNIFIKETAYGKSVCDEINIKNKDAVAYLNTVNSELNGGEINEYSIGNRYYILLLKKFISNRKSHSIIELKNGQLKNSTQNINEDKIIGYQDIKQYAIELINRIKHPEEDKAFGINPPGGILLYGPPGCGKTHWAKWFAENLNYQINPIKRTDFANSFVDGAVRGLSEIIETLKKKGPSVIFFDEFDDIGRQRKQEGSGNNENIKIVNYLLQEIEILINKGFIILAATNFLKDLDTALTRTGRFDDKIPIFPPLPIERAEILLKNLSSINIINDLLVKADADQISFWERYSEEMHLFSTIHTIKCADEIKIGLRKAIKSNTIENEVIYKTIEDSIKKVKVNISIKEREDFVNFYNDLLLSKYNDEFGRMKYLKIEIDYFFGTKGGNRIGY